MTIVEQISLTRRVVNSVRNAVKETKYLKSLTAQQTVKSNWFYKLITLMQTPLINVIIKAARTHDTAEAVLQAYENDSVNVDKEILLNARSALDNNGKELYAIIDKYHYSKEVQLLSELLTVPNTTR